AGAELAARLRAFTPPERSELKGNLVFVSRDDKATTTPILSVVSLATSNGWMISYWALAPDLSEELVIEHTPGRSNAYHIHFETNRAGFTTDKPPVPSSQLTTQFLSGNELVRPFAGSDFWLCDLGLEFLYWPQQRVLKHEMRRSRSCWVLESTTPQPA